MTITMPDLMTVPEGLGEVDWFDGFCGAGGSSNGLEFVPGFRVTAALNHWPLAVEAHNANFPEADHDVHDVQRTHPRRFRKTRCAWFSPECVNHAACRGKKQSTEEAVRSRMTMHDVVRYSEWHRYDAVIVENVVEARLWCEHTPPAGRSSCNCGNEFNRWLANMEWLGYSYRIVYFNSQFAGVPQSRDRMYVVFWRRGIPTPDLDFTPPSWCESCAGVVAGIQTWKKASPGSLRTRPGLFEWGRYGAQYVYTCPSCASIVAPAVMGAKYGINWADQGIRIGDRESQGLKALAPKTRQRIITGLQRLATTRPVQVQVGGHLYERPGYARVWSIDDPFRTVTGTPYMALVVPNMNNNVPRVADEPSGTVTSGNRHLLVQVNRGGNKGGRRAFPIDEPHPVSGHGEVGIVELRRAGNVREIDQPSSTIAANGKHHGLVMRAGGQAVSPRTDGEPSMAITAHDRQVGYLVYNGVPGFVRSLEDAAGTVTGRDKQSLLVPYYGTAEKGRTTQMPAGTVTSKDRAALVITEDDVDDCFFRMLQWPELLRMQAMHIRADGEPYVLTARRLTAGGKVRELSNEQRTKMIGNAVSSPVAAMLGHAVAQSLAQAA